jgi:hypothetical protein
MDDTDTRIYDKSAFYNGDKTRIVLTTAEQRPLTPVDFENILSTPFVISLERNGYVTDMQYAYRDGIDYKSTYSEEVDEFTGQSSITVSSMPLPTAPFMKTVPSISDGEFPLLEGRLPNGFYEVVAHESDGFSVGSTVTVLLINNPFWGSYQFAKMEFTVVGITDYGEGLYFDDSLGRFAQQIAKISNKTSDFFVFVPENLSATDKYVESLIAAGHLAEGTSLYLTDEQFRCHPNQYARFGGDGTYAVMKKFPNINSDLPLANANLQLLRSPDVIESLISRGVTIPNYAHNINHIRIIEVSENTFDKLTWNAESEQISLTIKDYATQIACLMPSVKRATSLFPPIRWDLPVWITQNLRQECRPWAFVLALCLRLPLYRLCFCAPCSPLRRKATVCLRTLALSARQQSALFFYRSLDLHFSDRR